MTAIDDTHPHLPPEPVLGSALAGARALLLTAGIVLLTVLSLHSADRSPGTGGHPPPDAAPAVEDWKGNSGSLPRAPVSPPAVRQGLPG